VLGWSGGSSAGPLGGGRGGGGVRRRALGDSVGEVVACMFFVRGEGEEWGSRGLMVPEHALGGSCGGMKGGKGGEDGSGKARMGSWGQLEEGRWLCRG